MYHPAGVVLTALLLASCTPPADPPRQSAPTVSRAEPEHTPDHTPLPPPPAGLPASIDMREAPIGYAREAPTSAVVQSSPPIAATGNLYVCVGQNGGSGQHTPLAYAPHVAGLCNKHPEMGPCRYERDVCRRSGGRVLTASGVEITMHTEAEYDKRVTRVRLGN